MVRPTVDLRCHLAGNATADMDLSSEKENLKDGLWLLDHRHFVYVKYYLLYVSLTSAHMSCMFVVLA